MIVASLSAFTGKGMAHSSLPARNMGNNLKTKLVVGIGATLILMSSLIISVYSVLQLKHIEEEVANLRWEITQLKLSGIADSQLIDDLKDFENEEMYSQIDNDYDLNYDDLESLFDSEEDAAGRDRTEVGNGENNVNKTRNKRNTKISVFEKNEAEVNNDKMSEKRSSNSPPSRVILKNLDVADSEERHKGHRRIRKRRAKATSRQQWEQIEDEEPTEPRRRNRHRQKNNIEVFDEKPRTVHVRVFPAIQLVGDTSKYIMGQHTNYNGNGHLQHRNPTYVDWNTNEWVQSAHMDKYFAVNDGTVTVKEHGLYFVYSQIFYLDEHDTNGYRVYKNQEVFLQCTTMTHSTERIVKGNTCYTGGLVVLNEGDNVTVQDLGTGRYSIFEPGKSFFGLVKMADIKVK